MREEYSSRESSSRLNLHYQNSRKKKNILLKWKNINYSLLQPAPYPSPSSPSSSPSSPSSSSSSPSKVILEENKKNQNLLKKNYNEKRILKGLSGQVQSRQLVAILGPTGCGKTSLINILAGKVPASGSEYIKLSGEISINNQPIAEKTIRKVSAYVTQDDNLYPHLTVRETLLLQAQFFMPPNTSKEKREAFVEDVILELGLIKASNTTIGNEKVRGVSGGERKRVSIATQLITDPSVLFLDEPTSGLDGFQAQSVMEAMKNLTENNRLVMAVIHQPRSSIFAMFDQLMILSEGTLMYHGKASMAVDYFSSLSRVNGEFTCPNNYNPSDFFLDLLSPDHRSPELSKKSSELIKYFGEKCREHVIEKFDDTNNLFQTELIEIESEINKNDQDEEKFLFNTSNISGLLKKNFESYILLVWRCFTESRRDVATIRLRLTIALFFCLVVGGLYSNGHNGQSSIYNRAGFFFFISINQGYPALNSAVNLLVKEKVIVNREVSGNAYTFLTYFLAKFTSEIPFTIVPALLFSLIVYWIVDLDPLASNYGMFIFIMLLEVISAMSLGLVISAFAPTIEAAMAIAAPFLTCLILFSGFYINIHSLPVVAKWIPYISFIRWSFQAFVTNEFQGSTIGCTASDIAEGQCITSGNQVIRNYFGANHSIAYPLMGQFIMIILFLSIAYLLLVASRVRYIHVGHIGSKVKSIEGEDGSELSPSNNITLIQSSSSKDSMSTSISASPHKYEIINTTSDNNDNSNNNKSQLQLNHKEDNVIDSKLTISPHSEIAPSNGNVELV